MKRIDLLGKIQSAKLLIFVWAGFLIAAVVSQPLVSINQTLLYLLISNTACCFLSILVRCSCSNGSDGSLQRRRRRNWHRVVERILITAPSIAISLLLLVRLFAIDHFLTVPSLLDFGPKKGDTDANNPNIAFLGGGFSSFGHCFQGFLASSLLTIKSVSDNSNVREQKKRVSIDENDDDGNNLSPTCCNTASNDTNFFNAAAYWGTIYPIYNFIKRYTRNQETFATSSYMNNGMEWVLGYWTGVAVGFVITLFHSRKLINKTTISGSTATGSGQHGSIESRISSQQATSIETTVVSEGKVIFDSTVSEGTTCQSMLSMIFLLFGWTVGALFLSSVFGACFMTGYTWNACEGDDEDCVNFRDEQDPLLMAIILTLIPTIVLLVALL